MEPVRKKARVSSATKEKDALDYLQDVRLIFADRPLVYHIFLDIMKEFKSKVIDADGVIERVNVLFKGHPKLIQGFNQFLPSGYNSKKSSKHAKHYVRKIQKRFADAPAKYAEFLAILREYQSTRAAEDVYARVNKLFNGEPDLLDEFKEFLPKGTSKKKKPAAIKAQVTKEKRSGRKRKLPVDIQQQEKEQETGAMYGNEIAVFNKIKRVCSRHVWNQFIRLLDMYQRKIINRAQLLDHVTTVLGPSSSLDHFLSIFRTTKNQLKKANRYKDVYIYTAEGGCDNPVTPSYHLIPDTVELPLTTGRSQMHKQVLNDNYVAISHVEESSFLSTPKNLHEEALFQAEDERYELDLYIGNNQTLIEVLEPIAAQLARVPQMAGKPDLGVDLEPLHSNVIHQMYREDATSVLAYLKESPRTAVPTVLARLYEKRNEYQAVKAELRPRWRQIARDNYTKSLDYRSYQFIATDNKRKTVKSLIEELRVLEAAKAAHVRYADISEDIWGSSLARLDRNNTLDCTDTEYAMRFDYSDAAVHASVHDIFNTACIYTLSEADRNKANTFWSGFLYHILGQEAEQKAATAAAAATTTVGVEGAENTAPVQHVTGVGGGMDTTEDDDDVKTSAHADSNGATKTTLLPVFPAPELYIATTTTTTTTTASDAASAAAATEEGDDEVKKEQETKSSSFKCPSRFVYGNYGMYHVFRLHQLLFTRLVDAKHLALKHSDNDPVKATRLFKSFLNTFKRLLKGKIKTEEYNRKCTLYFKSSAFKVSTLEALVVTLVKKVMKTVSKPVTLRLLQIYQYQLSVREAFLQASGGATELTAAQQKLYEAQYLNNISNILSQEKTRQSDYVICSKIAYFDNCQELRFGLEPLIVAPSTGPSQGVMTHPTEDWAKFARDFVNNPGQAAVDMAYMRNVVYPQTEKESRFVQAPPVFLNRTLRKSHAHDAVVTETRSRLHNALECWLGYDFRLANQQSVKFWYRTDTEDCLYNLSVKKAEISRQVALNEEVADIAVALTAWQQERRAQILRQRRRQQEKWQVQHASLITEAEHEAF